MAKKHPSGKTVSDAAKELPKKPQPKKEKEFEASIVSSAGNKKPKKK